MWQLTLELSQSRAHEIGLSAFIRVHLRQKIPCLRRWLRVCGASRGFADMSGFMESICQAGAGGDGAARGRVGAMPSSAPSADGDMRFRLSEPCWVYLETRNVPGLHMHLGNPAITESECLLVSRIGSGGTLVLPAHS